MGGDDLPALVECSMRVQVSRHCLVSPALTTVLPSCHEAGLPGDQRSTWQKQVIWWRPAHEVRSSPLEQIDDLDACPLALLGGVLG